MGSVILLGLVLAWAVVLIPAGMRRRAERGSTNSIGDFHSKLALIHTRRGDAVPGRPVTSFATIQPAARQASASVARSKARRAKKRRRDVFFGLLASVVGSAALAMIPGFKVLWMLNLALDALLVGYLTLLTRIRRGSVALAPRRSSGQPLLGQPLSGQSLLGPAALGRTSQPASWYDTGMLPSGYAYARAAND